MRKGAVKSLYDPEGCPGLKGKPIADRVIVSRIGAAISPKVPVLIAPRHFRIFRKDGKQVLLTVGFDNPGLWQVRLGNHISSHGQQKRHGERAGRFVADPESLRGIGIGFADFDLAGRILHSPGLSSRDQAKGKEKEKTEKGKKKTPSLKVHGHEMPFRTLP
jgi:hypothetical protein